MRELMPDGEDLTRAMRWVSVSLMEDQDKPVFQLVHQAILKFDLSPRDAESLIAFFRERKED